MEWDQNKFSMEFGKHCYWNEYQVLSGLIMLSLELFILGLPIGFRDNGQKDNHYKWNLR